MFFEKEFPDRIIEPQSVFHKQTELVVYNIQLSDPNMLGPRSRKEWRFVKYGFLTLDLLKKFPDHYVDGLFSPSDMLKLFVKLLMVSELSNGEYLMPCVLPMDMLSGCNPEPDTQSVPPMVLHFPGGPTRYGVFCGVLCHLMTESNWKLVIDPNSQDEPFHITRNSAHFALPGYLGKVTINDPLDTFFVVTVHVPSDIPAYSETVSCLCIEVRDTLVEAVVQVTKNLNYCPGTPNVAFLCAEHQDDFHPATIAAIGDILLCTKFGSIRGGLLTPGHKVWLGDASSNLTPPQPLQPPSIKAKPLLRQLQSLRVGKIHKQIIAEVGIRWEELAYCLEFSDSLIETVKENNSGRSERVQRSCHDMLRYWLDEKACKPVTWERLVQAIRDIPRKILAAEIETLLQPGSASVKS